MSLTRARLADYLQERFSLSVHDMDDDEPLFSSGLLDSINIIEVVAYVEEETGKTATAEDLTFDNFDSMQRILRFAGELASRPDHAG